MSHDKKNIIFGFVIIIAVVTFVIFGLSMVERTMKEDADEVSQPNSSPVRTETAVKLSKFSSPEEYANYMKRALQKGMMGGFGPGFGISSRDVALGMGGQELANPLPSTQSLEPRIYSETNVQVKGVDEPDVLKTDGKKIYFAKDSVYRIMEPAANEDKTASSSVAPCGPNEKCIAPPVDIPQSETAIINAFPASEIEAAGKIGKRGEMLLKENMLILLSEYPDRKIFGFDVTDSEKPKEVWNIEQKENTNLVSARMFDSKLYLINRVTLSGGSCDIRPLVVNGKEFAISCLDIYHPNMVLGTDSAYSIIKVDYKTGNIEDSTSFTSSSFNSALYMSRNSIYLTYQIEPEMLEFMTEFFEENSDLIPQDVMERIKKLNGYDISQGSKLSEFSQIMERYQSSLSSDDRLKLENEIKNRSNDYFKKKGRNISKTQIVKLDINDLEVKANGSIPGALLNQFSMDEHENNLRVATTVGGNLGFGFGAGESVNDVYVLNDKLEKTGEILDLGKGERIYSARFIGDQGYVVTFKQIDPFYVLDLSNPKKPEQKGELKIPGFSSYLHPLENDLIVGVGQEDGQVKLSLFDVSNASEPKEISKYMLDEFWSEAQYNHHAFMQDSGNKLIFIPGSKGGYFFSYGNNELKLAKAANFQGLKRAMYIDNFMYLVGQDAVVVLDKNNWEKVGEVEI